jgi:alpha-mannosidase
MARQLLEGVTYSREELGSSPEVVMAPDTFGHCGNLPQLATSAGARVYYHMRCNPGGDKSPWPAYWWEGDDGTRILAVSTPDYFGHITAGEAARSVVRAAAAGQASALQLYGVCDHGGAPTRQSLEALRRLQDSALLPRLICSTLAEYADALLTEKPDLPVHRGESSLTFRGCYTSHTDAKDLNRRGEELLTTADTLAVLAGLAEDSVLTAAWRTHLRHQFHDILGGSSIADVYADQAADANVVEAAARARIEESLRLLAGTASPGQVVVTNPHAWERTDVVEVPVRTGGPVSLVGSHGHTTPGQPTADGLCFVARVPGFTTVRYDVCPAEDAEHMSVEGGTGEQPVVARSRLHEVAVEQATGAVVSWSIGGRPALPPDARLNELQRVHEEPAPMSAWVIGRTRAEHVLDQGRSEVVETGPVRVVIETTHVTGTSTVRQRLTVYADIARIDVDSDVDWAEEAGAHIGSPGLKAAFHTGVAGQPTYETPFSTVTRADGGEVPALRWAALQDDPGTGVGVVNTGRHAHDAHEGTLRLRLLRTPYEPDPQADRGRHHARYAIVPLSTGWQQAALPRIAAGFGTPLLARVATEPIASDLSAPISVDADLNVTVAGLKPARCGRGVVVRVHECAGREGQARLHGLAPNSVVRRATIVEDELEELAVDGGAAVVTLRPFEVVTLVLSVRESAVAG